MHGGYQTGCSKSEEHVLGAVPADADSVEERAIGSGQTARREEAGDAEENPAAVECGR
jgi:hypothetical protein